MIMKKSESGLSMFEIILVIGVLMLVAPVVLRFATRNVDDIRHMAISKNIKLVERSLMNYASSNRQAWAPGSSDEIRENARRLLQDRFGLDPSVPEDLTHDMMIFRRKSMAGQIDIFAILDMSRYRLDDVALKQVLMHAGDTAGYIDGGEMYSITGAWSAKLSDITKHEVFEPESKIVLKVDDSMIDEEYASSLFLYRNPLGGQDGSTMLVPLSLGGHDIRNVGSLFVGELSAGSIKFNEGVIEGAFEITNGLNVDSRFNFMGQSQVEVRRLYLNRENTINNLYFPDGYLLMQEGNTRADISVGDTASMALLEVVGLSFSRFSEAKASISGLSSAGESALVADFGYAQAGTLAARIFSVQNGVIRSETMTAGMDGRIRFAGMHEVRLYNIKTTPTSPLLSGIRVNDIKSRFEDLGGKLMNDIKSMCAMEPGVSCGDI